MMEEVTVTTSTNPYVSLPAESEGIELDQVGSDSWFQRNRHRLAWSFFSAIYNSVFIAFIWLSRFAGNAISHYLASASIPAELANLGASLKKLVGREKPWWLLLAVVLPIMGLTFTMVIFDLVKFGVITAGPLAAIAGAGPYIFTGAFVLFGTLTAIRVGQAIEAYFDAKAKGTLTPLHSVRIVSRTVKATMLFALGLMIAPFMAATLVNPFGAVLYAVGITVAVVTLVAIKAYKTHQENKQWAKTIETLNEKNLDPYEELKIDREYLESLVEIKEGQKSLGKLRAMFSKVSDWFKMQMASEEEKKELEKQAKQKELKTPAGYIKAQVEKQLEGANSDRKQALANMQELLKKNRGREMYEAHERKKTIEALKGKDPYEILGTTRDEINQLVEKEKQSANFLERLFGDPAKKAVENQLGYQEKRQLLKELKAVRDSYGVFVNSIEIKQLESVLHVVELLKSKEGRKEADKYLEDVADFKEKRESRKMISQEKIPGELDGLMPQASGAPVNLMGKTRSRSNSESSESQEADTSIFSQTQPLLGVKG